MHCIYSELETIYMSLTEEYKKQCDWRNWETYLDKLPISQNDTILDLGCSIGTVTSLLANKAKYVIGIDINPKLIEEAKKSNSAKNIDYIISDLNNIRKLDLPNVDGIWTSFLAAYFPDFDSALRSWLPFLKSEGWIGIVEMADLFAHAPLSQTTHDIFKEYYLRQLKNGTYDFEMGFKIKDSVIKSCLSIIHEENTEDQELTFSGPAEQRILKAWGLRFDRMTVFKEYLGDTNFLKIKKEFLDCLSNTDHKSKTIIKYIVTRK